MKRTLSILTLFSFFFSYSSTFAQSVDELVTYQPLENTFITCSKSSLETEESTSTETTPQPPNCIVWYPTSASTTESENTDGIEVLGFLNARYHDANQGQFISQDPVFWELGLTKDGQEALLNPQLQNSYSYGVNNPITNKDPDGRCPICLAVLAGGLFGITYLNDTNIAAAPGSPLDIATAPNTVRIFDNALASSAGYDYNSWSQWRKNQMAEGVDALAMSLSLGSLGVAKYSQFSSARNINSIQSIGRGELPSNVQASLKQYESVGWTGKGRSSGTKVGAEWENIDIRGNSILPTGVAYKEYDVNNKMQGLGRDSQRFLKGSDGSIYYTDNHYESFQKISK